MHGLFDGRVGSQTRRQIDLGGRSNKADTREEILERTRQEREKRRQAKEQQQAATTIQARWRACSRAWHIQEHLRNTWQQEYGSGCEPLSMAAVQLPSRCLSILLTFSCTTGRPLRPSTARAAQSAFDLNEVQLSDVRCVARMASCVLSTLSTPQGLAVLLPLPQHMQLGQQHAQQLARQLSQLVEHCLGSLSLLATFPEARAALGSGRRTPPVTQLPPSSPTPHLPPSPSSSSVPLPLHSSFIKDTTCVLAELIIALMAPEAWASMGGSLSGSCAPSTEGVPSTEFGLSQGTTTGSTLGVATSTQQQSPAEASAAAAASVITRLLQGRGPPSRSASSGHAGFFRQLARLLLSVSSSGSGAGAAGGRPLVEQLTTQLCVRLMGLRQHPLLLAQLPSQQGPHLLLCVPNLWTTLPSLAPLTTRLTRMAAAAVASPSFSRWPVRSLLGPQDGMPCGQAGAAAALLVNLIQGGVRATAPGPVASAQAAQFHLPARQLCVALHRLLCFLPWERFMGVNEPCRDSDEPAMVAAFLDATMATHNSSGLVEGRLVVPEEDMVPSELTVGLQAFTESSGWNQLLLQLVRLLLPVTGPGDIPAREGGSDSGSVACASQYFQGALLLCQLLQQIECLTGRQQRLYTGLAVSGGLVPRLWWSVLRGFRMAELSGLGLPAAQATPREDGPIIGSAASPLMADKSLLLLRVLCLAFDGHMALAAPEEFPAGQPLALEQLYSHRQPATGLLMLLKDRLWACLWTPDAHEPKKQPSSVTPGSGSAQQQQVQVSQWSAQWGTALRAAFVQAGGGLYGSLYDRCTQATHSGSEEGGGAAFCPPAAFHASTLGPDRFAQEAAAARGAHVLGAPGGARGRSRTDLGARIWQVLRWAPALAPFEERARLFQAEVAQAKQEALDSEFLAQQEAMMMGTFQPNRFIEIRRDHMLYDGFDQLSRLGPEALQRRVRVTFTDDTGAQEAGVDGGGLFKDFLAGLVREGFGGGNALFLANASNELYPNPAAFAVIPDAPRLLHFLGRMLGKALWEGILLELPLARFFLKQLRGVRCDLRELPSLDAQLYKNLLSLRAHKGDVADLALTFTVTHESFGSHTEVELKPGGTQQTVTEANVTEYIARITDFRLNVEPGRAVAAFATGFQTMVQPEWVALFNEAELQMLISGRPAEGGRDAGINLEDLRQHTHYAGGYHEEHPVMVTFWEALHTLDPSQQRAFLKFITSCSRAPLLGFKYLEPGLCVQLAGSVLDPRATDRLPTAATCVNMLKLPPYRSTEEMRHKLITAITGSTTFDLS